MENKHLNSIKSGEGRYKHWVTLYPVQILTLTEDILREERSCDIAGFIEYLIKEAKPFSRSGKNKQPLFKIIDLCLYELKTRHG